MIKENQLQWLLEPGDIGVKYLALRDLLEPNAGELIAAKKKAHAENPDLDIIPNIRALYGRLYY
jgi:hypothetical protein